MIVIRIMVVPYLKHVRRPDILTGNFVVVQSEYCNSTLKSATAVVIDTLPRRISFDQLIN